MIVAAAASGPRLSKWRFPTSGVVMWSPIRKASEYTRFLASVPSLGHLIAETVSNLAAATRSASMSQRHESQPSDAASRETPHISPHESPVPGTHGYIPSPHDPQAHRVSIRLSFCVSVYITDLKTPPIRLDEGNIRRIDSTAHRKACSSIAILSPAANSPQTHTHFSQYFTGLHNLAP
jgi:hypothetical protein